MKLEHPFYDGGECLVSTFRKILEKEAPSLENTDYSQELIMVVNKLLAKEPERRGDAKDVKNELMRALKALRNESGPAQEENVLGYDIVFPPSIFEMCKTPVRSDEE
jgi:hypothetical protein